MIFICPWWEHSWVFFFGALSIHIQDDINWHNKSFPWRYIHDWNTVFRNSWNGYRIRCYSFVFISSTDPEYKVPLAIDDDVKEAVYINQPPGTTRARCHPICLKLMLACYDHQWFPVWFNTNKRGSYVQASHIFAIQPLPISRVSQFAQYQQMHAHSGSENEKENIRKWWKQNRKTEQYGNKCTRTSEYKLNWNWICLYYTNHRGSGLVPTYCGTGIQNRRDYCTEPILKYINFRTERTLPLPGLKIDPKIY